MEKRIEKIFSILKEEYLNTKGALNFSNPLQVLIATILSAQCTDERVNKVTKNLFKKYRITEDYAKANIKELEKDIHSTGFYKNKAKAIKGAATLIIKKYKGNVPRTMEELITLPGVARKTANIVLGNAYGIVEGIAVDTHVKRLSQRLGLSKEKDPQKIENNLMGILPKKQWFETTYLLIEHGRKVCKAPTPICSTCKISLYCPRIGVTKSK